MISCFGLTDIGRKRLLNEDAIHIADGLLVVCDGMGGHKAGEVASRIAIDSIAAFVNRSGDDPEITWPYGFDPRISFNGNRLRTAIKLANRAVFRKASSSDDYTGMGTTAVVALVPAGGAQMTYAGVGDSRIYLVRGGELRQLTRDDSWANMADEDAPPDSKLKNVLTKAVGAQEDVEFDVQSEALADGDLVVLCSDGLTNMVPPPRILEILSAHAADLAAACAALIEDANLAGGRDNISVIIARYDR